MWCAPNFSAMLEVSQIVSQESQRNTILLSNAVSN